MIQKESFLKVADNSGAKLLKVFHLVGSTRKRYAFIGDIVRCSVKSAIPQGMVKKGDIVDVIIVRTKKALRRADGTYVSFSENAGVIIKDEKMLATRIFGPIAREIRATGQSKIISSAPEVV
jgi:large subunit ribosomal protein L14